MHTALQAARHSVTLFASLASWEMPLGQELIIQLVFGQMLCLNPLCQGGFRAVLMGLCAS